MSRIDTPRVHFYIGTPGDLECLGSQEVQPPSSRPGGRLEGLRQATETFSTPGPVSRRGAFRRNPVKAGAGARASTPASASQSASQSASEKPALLSSLGPQQQQASTAHYEKHRMPTDPQALGRFLVNAQLADYVYHRDPTKLPDGWTPAEEMADEVRREMGLRNDGVERGTGALVDRGSGLTAVVLRCDKTNEVVVAFGGTTAGKKTGDTLVGRSRPGRNFMSTLSQWGANVYAGFGGSPKSYEQAAALLRAVQHRADKGDTVRLIGHSKGGGETTYASLSAEHPVDVDNFCTAHLCDGLVSKLRPENLARAKELVRSFSPYGDPVAGLRGKLPGHHGVGVGHHFEGIPGRGIINKHDQFLQHVRHYCEQQEGLVNPKT